MIRPPAVGPGMPADPVRAEPRDDPASYGLDAARLRTLAERAVRSGLAVTQSDGSIVPIPIGALPVVIDDAECDQRGRIAATLLAATAKAARWRLDAARRADTFAELRPVEQRLVAAAAGAPLALAVGRVDCLPGTPLAALEVNATIPAMQGYSDIAASTWIAAVAHDHPERDRLILDNGSNAAALLAGLQALHAQRRREPLRTLGLLCRHADAQRSELLYLRDRFRAAGLDARLVHPDALRRDGHGLRDDQGPLDLIYRHLFLHRLAETPSAALEWALGRREERGTLILNPPAPHLEMKSTLALLSSAAEDARLADALDLADEEREALRTHLPWTRRLRLDGVPGALDDAAVDRVLAEPDRYVLKRSWSYGGHDVFLGRDRESARFRSALAARGLDGGSWATLVRNALQDREGGGFVVQEAVVAARAPQWLCTPNGARRAEVTTDYAAYASLGASPAWSGVSRASEDAVVNIVRGGAVVPVLRRSVFERIAAWCAARCIV